MKYLTKKKASVNAEKVLSNWVVCAGIIYQDSITINDLSVLLLHEVQHKNRDLIVDRLKTRLISIIKTEATISLNKEIEELLNVCKGPATKGV